MMKRMLVCSYWDVISKHCNLISDIDDILDDLVDNWICNRVHNQTRGL